MKKSLTILLTASLLTGCGTSQGLQGDPNAIIAGASIGGNVGGAIGGLIGDSGHSWHGGYRGSAIGTIIGTLAGAAIGNAVSTPRQQPQERPSEQMPANTAMESVFIRNIRFIDEGRDQTVNAGEECKIVFDIVNEGSETAFNIIPTVTEISGAKQIYLSPSVMVDEIGAGEGVKYTAHLSAGRKLKNGTLTIRIALDDTQGWSYDQKEFTLNTRR